MIRCCAPTTVLRWRNWTQYPKVLKNWWCDDWISNVYGSKRTKKLASQEVKHLISATRYQVSQVHCAR